MRVFPAPAVVWQGIAAVVANILAFITGVGAYKSTVEQRARTTDIKGWRTGGDSYPYLYPFVATDPAGTRYVTYLIAHAGSTYPLYDLPALRCPG